LDPSIRHHLQKRGVSVKENTYIGFDTEFTKSGAETNSLVSVQLAVTTKTYIQIPRVSPYSLSQIDDKSNRLSKVRKLSPNLNYAKIESSIQLCISGVRNIKYEQTDTDMLILTECLRLVKGLSYKEKDEYTVFSLPRSVIQPFIHFGDSYSIKEIIEVSSGLALPFIEESNKILMELIKQISSQKFNLLLGKEKLVEEIYRVFGNYLRMEELSNRSDITLPFLTSQILPEVLDEVLDEKRLARNYLVD
jgi:hypothetical protein